MKNISLQLFFIVVIGVSVHAQVGIGTVNPDTSSMLDVQSTTKGMLIPRMTTAQRTIISSPANGLLVFDTTTSSFWFYSGSWKELVGETTLADTDSDTKIEVEKTSDSDEINFSTSGTERMKIDANGVIIMGDSTATSQNYTKITTDGSLSYVGEATRWDDLKVPMNATNRGTTNQPEWLLYRNNGTQGIWLWSFSKNVEEELYFVVQMPHGWKEGTDIFPHVHWTSKVGDPGNVKWALEYTWSNVGGNFGVPVIVSSSSITVGDSSTAYNHNLTALPTISGSGKTLSSMLICRVYRDGDDASDTFNNEAQILELDFHYKIDSDGSNEPFTKW